MTDQSVRVGERVLTLRNLEKVLYPTTGTTKAEVLSYYTHVASAMLPHITGRPATRKRWPDGVDGPSFFEKNLPNGTPDWVRRVRLPVPGSMRDRETIIYPLIDDLAALVWVANLAALEVHVPQWLAEPSPEGESAKGTAHAPDRLVIDLDPGAPAGLAECTEVAFAVRQLLADDGLECFPVTSGGKGMQLYARLGTGDGIGRAPEDAESVVAQAKSIAETLERRMGSLVVSRMTKSLRPGKVFIDWSQNNPAKTTIAPYSLRGRGLPTVAAPRTWQELEEGGLTQLDHAEVLARVSAEGDLLAGLLP
ncbi:MAG: non-homologous end-joining DNA ligase [Kineosporiaceae bacterium]|nr:non-homologous end-joining DNA ligase [Kineosporiaceae bacterium]